MATRICEKCGQAFVQKRGRPAKYCKNCRRRGDRYGAEHRRLREATVAEYVGTPCARCGEVMTDPSTMHLDHDDSGEGYIGYSHAWCNVKAGASRGGQATAATRYDFRTDDPEWAAHFTVCSEIEDRGRCRHSRPWTTGDQPEKQPAWTWYGYTPEEIDAIMAEKQASGSVSK